MLEAIISGALSEVISNVISGAMKTVSRRNRVLGESLESRIETGLSRHLTYVANMTARVQIFGMATSNDLQASTVALEVRNLPRRFKRGEYEGEHLSEFDLLLGDHSCVLLGDPGAGKTTTIKRLAQRLLTEPPTGTEDRYAFPILIVCREHDWAARSLVSVIWETLDLPSEYPTPSEVKTPPQSESVSVHRKVDYVDDDAVYQAARRSEIEGARKEVIYTLLDHGPVLLLVDGLDEVPTGTRAELEKDIEQVANHTAMTKVIVSCRSGDYSHIEGLDVVELCPLDDQQIDAVAGFWLEDSRDFLRALRESPVADLGSRPLFLAQLLIIYRNSGGSIPEQPASLYRRITRLLLQDWDEQRRVVRRSNYAGFDVDDKLEFLSALSYELMIKKKILRFDTSDLVTAYQKIAPQVPFATVGGSRGRTRD